MTQDSGAVDSARQDESLLQDWPLRPWVSGGLLALCGFLIHLIVFDDAQEVPWRAAAAAFVGFGGMAGAFTLSPRRWMEPAGFALLIGLVMAGIAWQLVAADGQRAGAGYAFAAGCFFCLLALPLFQADFHRTRFATPYPVAHFHAWADAVSAGGALAFVGLSWLLLNLLDGLFGLVGIHLFQSLMREEWFGWTWSGAAFGAGLGVIRNNLKVVGALQKVVMLVFAILGVPFALALLVFLAILLGTGGEALWEATDSATPILLACAAGAFLLYNAIIRDDDGECSGNRVMQIAALLLAGLILPLSVFAAISMGMRVGQHGLSPERIWALVAIAVSCAFGLGGWVALVRGRMAGWMGAARTANLHLAAGVCVLALILALPIWDFGAMSAKNQIARLQAGKVSAQDFDFSALRWDFGDAGRESLARLADGEGDVAELAAKAQAEDQRPYGGARTPTADRLANFTGIEADTQANEAFDALLKVETWRCQTICRAMDLGLRPDGQRHFALVQGEDVTHLQLGDEGLLEVFYPSISDAPLDLLEEPLDDQGDLEVREVRVRRIYVGDRPVGQVFE